MQVFYFKKKMMMDFLFLLYFGKISGRLLDLLLVFTSTAGGFVTHISTRLFLYCYKSSITPLRLTDCTGDLNSSLYSNIFWINTHYMHTVLVKLFVLCQVYCVNNITTRCIASSSDAVYLTDEA